MLYNKTVPTRRLISIILYLAQLARIDERWTWIRNKKLKFVCLKLDITQTTNCNVLEAPKVDYFYMHIYE